MSNPLSHGSNGPRQDDDSWAKKQGDRYVREQQAKDPVQRVTNYLVELTEGKIGVGEDPVGFLMASHATFSHHHVETLRNLDSLVHNACIDFEEDISDRRGLSDEWDQIDDDIKDEIRAKWRSTLKDRLLNALRISL